MFTLCCLELECKSIKLPTTFKRTVNITSNFLKLYC